MKSISIEKNTLKKNILRYIFSAVFSVIILLGTIFSWFTPVDNFFMDNMYQKSSSVDPNIKIIAIDDKTMEQLGHQNTWDRGIYADLVDRLNEGNHKPAVIGFDILFTGNRDVASDDRFALACKNGGNVVAGMNVIFGDQIYDEKEVTVSEATIVDVSYPYEALNDVVKTGFVNSLEDSIDSKVRRSLMSIKKDSNYYESFSYVLYKEYMSYYSLGVNEYDSNHFYRFKYSSLPNDLYSVISLSDVLNGKIPLSDFEGSLVLVGAYATGLQDQFYTPITSADKMNGVEIHANMINAYIKDKVVAEPNYDLVVILNVLLVCILAFIIYKLPILKTSIVSAVSCGVLLLAQTILDLANIYYSFMSVIILIIIIYICSIVLQYIFEKKSKKQIMNAFKKYVAPQVVEKAIKDGSYELNLGGEKRNIACLFVDIRGFTPLSEKLEPINVIEILNEYLSLTTNAIFKNGGTLDKFIGDATMAIFNAPFDLDDYAYRAVLTAWDIAKESKKIEDLFMERFGCKVSYGIGVNLGDAVIGNIGCDFRMDYTAIGDTVNTAARLESNAKAGEILISEELYLAVKDRIEATFIGGLKMKGKSKEVNTYLVTGIKEVQE